jgi:electron transfer flavoprotein alpha subunit
MATLVFLEHHEGELLKPALGVLSKAAELGGDVAGVVLGSGVRDLAPKAGAYGASKVYVADKPELERPLPQPRVDGLAKLVQDQGIDTVLFAASVLSADVAAGLSARLGAGLNWDLTDLVQENGSLIGKRPALGDSVYVDVGWSSEPRLALIRAGTFDVTETHSVGEAQVEDFDFDFEDFSLGATMVEQAHASRAVAGSARRTTSSSSRSSLRHLAEPSPPPARSSTQGGTPTRRRWDRPGRPSRPSSMSPAGSRARSSTRSGCRAPG